MDESLQHQWSEPRVAAFFQAHPTRTPRTASFVPQGWDNPVADALTTLLDIERASGKPIRIAQIKEKFGGLRIYVDIDEDSAGPLEVVRTTPASTHLRSLAAPGSARFLAHTIIDEAALRAEFYCIQCGAPATARDRYYRLCTAHSPRTQT